MVCVQQFDVREKRSVTAVTSTSVVLKCSDYEVTILCADLGTLLFSKLRNCLLKHMKICYK